MSDDQSPTFSVALNADGSVAVLTVTGDLEYFSTGAFQAKLNEAMRRARYVVVDLHGVNYMDSSSLRAMLVARVQREVGTFAVRGVAGALLHQLRFTGVLDILGVESDSTEP